MAVVLLAGVAIAQGQTPTTAPTTQPTSKPVEKATSQTHPQNPELWDVEQMMEDAVQQISRRYNLNKAQENYTRLLLVGRVREFLDKNEKEVRELLKESIDLRLHPDKATPEANKKWAERAGPIYDAARKTILEGNAEWREILNEEQKKIHDSDLAQMKANFEQVNQVIEDWKAGKGSGRGATSDRPPPVQIRMGEDNWLTYVTLFISAYQLDEKQTNSAKEKIYKEFFGKAKAYRERKKEDFDKIEAELRSPSKDQKKPTRPVELMQKKGELERPIRKMFMEMDERLIELLRSDQKTSIDKEKKKQLEILYKQLSGEVTSKDSEKMGGPSTRPDEKPTTSSAPADDKGGKRGEVGPPKEPTTQKSETPAAGDKKVEPSKPSSAEPAKKTEPEKKAEPEKKPEPAPKVEKPPTTTRPATTQSTTK
jgi:hypothetical protein